MTQCARRVVKDVWFENWQVKSNYGVHPATREKLKREGFLVGRDLKRPDGTIYFTVYLMRENKGFLKKYPRQDSKVKITISDKDGKSIEL